MHCGVKIMRNKEIEIVTLWHFYPNTISAPSVSSLLIFLFFFKGMVRIKSFSRYKILTDCPFNLIGLFHLREAAS
jgi:hypothetical protein